MDASKHQADFASLYAQHAESIRRQLIRRGVRAADLDDVVQETFVTIHKLLPSFERRSSVETWLHSVTWRVAANYRRRVRGQTELLDWASETASHEALSEADSEPVMGPRLHRAFTAIGAEQRDLLALHEIGGFSLSQISELTGNARATIRERLARGRSAVGRALWKTLTDHDQEAWLEQLVAGLAEPGRAQRAASLEPIVCAQTAIATLDDIVITVWRGPSSVQALTAIADVMFSITDRDPGGFRYLAVIEPTSTPPSREARRLMAWIGGHFGPHNRAAAVLVETSRLTGLVAPVMNSCFFIGGVPINLRFFNAMDPALSWMSKFGTTASADMAECLRLMRQRLNDECELRP